MRPATDAASSGLRVVAAATVLLVATVTGLLGPGEVGSTRAALTAKADASTQVTTAAACASGTPYVTHVAALPTQPTFWWRFGEAVGATTVADSSPNSSAGTVAGTAPASGVTLGDPGLLECDTSGSLRLLPAAAGTGFVVLPAPRTAATTLTIALWVRAAPGAVGGLLTFADSAAGTATVADRSLTIDASGRAVVTVLTDSGPVEVRTTMATPVTDDTPHLLVATLAPGAPGRHDLRLYLDGAPADVATDLVLAGAYPGYWRTGSATGPTADSQVDEIAVWEGSAMGQTQVADLAAADHW